MSVANTQRTSTSAELTDKVYAIIKGRARSFAGKTRAEGRVTFDQMDVMAKPEVFCDPTIDNDPRFAHAVFYDQLSRSREDQGVFAQMVIARVSDPHCECAATLHGLAFSIPVPDPAIVGFMETGQLPPQMTPKRRPVHRPNPEWPMVGIV